MEDLFKWVFFILVGLFLVNWISNRLASQLAYSGTDGGSIWGSGWAPPIVAPSPVQPYVPWWKRGVVSFSNGTIGGNVAW